jgi:hypothetical protein
MEDKKKAEEILQKAKHEIDTPGHPSYGKSIYTFTDETLNDYILAKSSEALPSDEEIREWAKDVEIEGRDEEKMSGFDYMVFAAKTMRDMIRNRLQGGK